MAHDRAVFLPKHVLPEYLELLLSLFSSFSFCPVGHHFPHGGSERDPTVVSITTELLQDRYVLDGRAGEPDVGDAVEEYDADETLFIIP